MVYNKIRELIGQADAAIREGRFDDLAEFYTDDAVLVVRPGMEAHGKDEIKRAFMAIARYFNGSVSPRQGNMVILEAGPLTDLCGRRQEAGQRIPRRAPRHICVPQRKRPLALRG